MALKFISPNDSENNEDLPWVNEYLNTVGQVGDSSVVRRIVQTPKGYLIISSSFKGFVFNKSTMAKHLTEALAVWITNQTINYPLFAVAVAGGKLQLAIDDEMESSQWLKDNNSWEQRLKKVRGSGYLEEPSNPLLPTSPPTSLNGKRGKQTATPTNPT